MTDRRLDVLAVGNAIVDVIADAKDEFLELEGMHKGAMRLIDEAEAKRLYEAMGPGRELSGGSAGNTVAGVASLGLSAGFVGQLASDQLGEIYEHDIHSLGIEFKTPLRSDVGATARSLILVTSDAQRTMNTYLGAAQRLGPDAVDQAQISRARILYLEGYLWDPEQPRRAMVKAIEAARSAGTKVAFTLSDSFVVDRHRADLWKLFRDGVIDILFANEAEIMSLAEHENSEEAALAVAAEVPTVVVTRSEKGAFALRGGERFVVPAEPIRALVDTTGAGDLFAAGYLAGEARGAGAELSLRLGAICAAEVIQHYGARPEANLKELAGGLLD
ncbi:MAG TPA: adenosine kinase [Sphingomicrobium sp.]|jgi:sugar/nucleoside kinase (ribokinase family)|nr:adenosine kinase [Sphingomicrobium sp.]